MYIDNLHIEIGAISSTARGIIAANCDKVFIGPNVTGLTRGDLCLFNGNTSNSVSKLTSKSQQDTGPVFSDVSSAASTNKGKFSIGVVGYHWSGDIFEQWGSQAGTPNASSHLVITFPVPFPNALFAVNAVNRDAAAGVENFSVFNKTVNGFTVYCGRTISARRVDWMAKGN